MVRNTSPIALAGLACAFVAGCGGDDPRDVATAKPRPAKARPAEVDLEPFLMQAGEEPGFKPHGEARVQIGGEPLPLPADGAERLRRSGYISMIYQPISGENGNAGVGSVSLFETEAGALAWMKYETSTKAIRQQIPGAKIRRFKVRGLPNARGWTGPDRHGNRIGNIFWVQGRCMLALANEGKPPFDKLLVAGAKAIRERTNGVCPG